jgi:L-cystine uptake protein TcyP (sodium:dicarboxylate symporter family)
MESLKRLVGVLFAPTETFRKIAERPTWAVALVVLLMLGAAVGVVVAQKLDLDAERDLIRQQIEDRQGLRGDELESQVDRVANINSKIRPFTPALVVVFGTGIYLLVSFSPPDQQPLSASLC